MEEDLTQIQSSINNHEEETLATIETSEKPINQAFKEEFKEADTEQVNHFVNTQPGPGKIRQKAIILSQRRYKFKDNKSGDMVTGVTFTTTDGIIENNEKENNHGINIEEYSVKGDAMYEKFNKLPTPPITVVLDIKISGRKTTLEKMYYCKDINKKINETETESVLASKEEEQEKQKIKTSPDLWQICLDEKENAKNAIYRFAWRLTQTDKNKELIENPDKMQELLKKLDPQTYVFQLEKGEKTQKLHYQGYLKLKTKIRPKQLARQLQPHADGIEIAPAFSEVAIKIYCQKKETRVSGPWSYPP